MCWELDSLIWGAGYLAISEKWSGAYPMWRDDTRCDIMLCGVVAGEVKVRGRYHIRHVITRTFGT